MELPNHAGHRRDYEARHRAEEVERIEPHQPGAEEPAAIGIGALPASLLFGLLWDRFGSGMAFTVGAGLSLAAAAALLVLPDPGT